MNFGKFDKMFYKRKVSSTKKFYKQNEEFSG